MCVPVVYGETPIIIGDIGPIVFRYDITFLELAVVPTSPRRRRVAGQHRVLNEFNLSQVSLKFYHHPLIRNLTALPVAITQSPWPSSPPHSSLVCQLVVRSTTPPLAPWPLSSSSACHPWIERCAGFGIANTPLPATLTLERRRCVLLLPRRACQEDPGARPHR